MEQVLYGIDYIEYYFYWIYYKFIGYKNMFDCCNVLHHCVPISFITYHIWYIQQKERKT